MTVQVSRSILVSCCVVLLASICDPARSEDKVPSGRRVALLLGNYNYAGATLESGPASLDVVESAAEEQGFEIQRHDNLSLEEMKSVCTQFVTSTPTNGVALIYYYGLGAHVDRLGRWYNLLRPIGAKIVNDNDYRSRALNLNDIAELCSTISGARNTLIFLDAAWDSPIRPSQDKVFSGIREIELADGMCVATAAQVDATVSMPNEQSPSELSRAVAGSLARFNQSASVAAKEISAAVDGWFQCSIKGGVGEIDRSQLLSTPDLKASAGDVYVNSTGMLFRWCPAGVFRMGDDRVETAATRDREAVDVTLSAGFWLGEYEVTQREHRVVTRRNPNKEFTLHRNAPWWGASELKTVEDFCKKLNEVESKAGTLPPGWSYTCPTEAEWEYACRAGRTTAWSFGNDVGQMGRFANFADAALRRENPDVYWASTDANDGIGEALAQVGSYRPNDWGLRDMHGNVAEIVADHHSGQLPGGTDPLVRVKKDGRTVIRGGGWCSTAEYCESSFRNTLTGRDKLNYVGFRVALKKVK